MRILFRYPCFVVALIAFAACGGSEPSAADIEQGRELFLSSGCAACHGRAGDGNGPSSLLAVNKPRDFSDATSFKQGHTIDAISETIEKGVARGATGMPGSPTIPERERRKIAAWVMSLSQTKEK
jgi:mono/diheme cytochrome c family protein